MKVWRCKDGVVFLNKDMAVSYSLEYGLSANGQESTRLMQACWNERVRRDSLVMLATAEKAIERARTGVCNQGVGDCPVHQMGSCRIPDYMLRWPGYKTACD